ncbi:membrane-bound lytic murein transglycosylase MltC [Pseudodesulfovibrio sp.]|uniref:membrane-bound lytic murein transglycosylase MltC n=1 Tax=unclassified Pseudodesulfovibrio TaxID=2661612 RepID=UPI003B00AAF9
MSLDKFCIPLVLLILLTSCSRYDAVRIARAAATGSPAAAAEALARDKAFGYASNPSALATDLKQFKKVVDDFVQAVGRIWGKGDTRVPQPKTYVKYTHNYLSRASVDFDTGVITVETVDQKAPSASLKSAIVTTLLTPGDPRAVDLYSDKPIKLGETPFLMGEVKDADGKDIRWAWRAERYADHLITTGLKTRKVNGKTAHYVTFGMVSDHLDVRARKYRSFVMASAKRFSISRNLIYAIMKVESDFNPFAVSNAMAIGLMQVVQKTAGSDVYQLLHGKAGSPSRETLFDPAGNITYGTAYLHLLDVRFLSGINDHVAREYCVIAGYNGGAGAVLRTFDGNKDRAKKRINAMSTGDVYRKLKSGLPRSETRRYLDKVIEAKKHFVNF